MGHKRYLQLGSAAYYGVNFALYVSLFFIFAYTLIFTRFWFLFPLSVLWTWYDKDTPDRGGRAYEFVRKTVLLKYFRDYFPMELVKTAELDPERNYIFGCYPHGVLCLGIYGNFVQKQNRSEELFPGVKFFNAAADFNFKFPVIRDIIMAWGYVSASWKSLIYLLEDSKKGNVVTLMIGGAKEICYVDPRRYKIILEKRKGFVKLALTVGCSLVPVFTFGENDVYSYWTPSPGSISYRIHQWILTRTGIYSGIPFGYTWVFPYLPKRSRLVTIVGKPIEVPKTPRPTQELIDRYHSLYKEELFALFEDNKHKYVEDPENTRLEIVE